VAKPKTVWLLGAQSFTGKYLYHALIQQGYDVDTSRVDITNYQQVESAVLSLKPDYIINLAAISFVPDGSNESIYGVNTFGPENILKACLKLTIPPQKIILASSANIYGQQQQESITEACIAKPINHYGCSKWAMEQIVHTYQDRLPILITRPFNYTGHGQDAKFLVPKIVQHFHERADKIELGNIDIWRDFSDVRWVADVYVALLEMESTITQPINLCSSQLTSIRDIIEHLTLLSGHHIEIEVNPEFVRSTDIARQMGCNNYLFECLPQLTPSIDFKHTLEWMLNANTPQAS